MTYSFRVRPHPLGVVVYCGGRSELLIPDEEYCGVSFEALQRAAASSQVVEVEDAAVADCPLQAKSIS